MPRLIPTVVSARNAKQAVADSGRKRPVLARDAEGQLVTCSRRTATRNGWTIEKVAYDRHATVALDAKGKLAPAPAPAPTKGRTKAPKLVPAPTPAVFSMATGKQTKGAKHPLRRSTDTSDSVLVPKSNISEAAALLGINELLEPKAKK